MNNQPGEPGACVRGVCVKACYYPSLSAVQPLALAVLTLVQHTLQRPSVQNCNLSSSPLWASVGMALVTLRPSRGNFHVDPQTGLDHPFRRGHRRDTSGLPELLQEAGG